MLTRIIISFAILVCLQVNAQTSDLSELEVGSKKQDAQTYLSQTDAELISHMNNEIEEKCDDHGCTFVSRVDHKKGWTIGFNIGNGNNNNGTSIYLNGGQSANSNQNYAGVSLSYTNMNCISDFKIDMDDFINNKARAIQERDVDGTYAMKPLTSDYKFVQLLKLEIYKQLGQSGCLR